MIVRRTSDFFALFVLTAALHGCVGTGTDVGNPFDEPDLQDGGGGGIPDDDADNGGGADGGASQDVGGDTSSPDAGVSDAGAPDDAGEPDADPADTISDAIEDVQEDSGPLDADGSGAGDVGDGVSDADGSGDPDVETDTVTDADVVDDVDTDGGSDAADVGADVPDTATDAGADTDTVTVDPFADRPAGACITSRDCGFVGATCNPAPGGVCGGCIPEDDVCGPTEECQFGSCVVVCDTDAECPAGRFCSTRGICASVSCARGVCPVPGLGCSESGLCSRVPCATPGDVCPAASTCVSGTCIENRAL